ncbi:MAG: glycosyl hydrolase family 28-related protein [Gemmatimonadales bacterium]
MVSVAEFGAIGDGSDETAKIQAAIDAADAQGGGIVFFPPGTYTIANSLTLAHGIWLIGASRENCKLRASSAILMIDGRFASAREYNAGMAHLTVDGNGVATGCLELDLTSGLYFLDCVFTSAVGATAGRAVKLNTAVFTVWENCKFNSSRVGFDLNQSGTGAPNMSAFRDCRFESNSEVGLKIEGTTGTGILGVDVDGCTFYNNGTSGNNAAGGIWADVVRSLSVTHSYFESNKGGASIHLIIAVLPRITKNYFTEAGPLANGAVWAETVAGSGAQIPIITDNNFDGSLATNVTISSGAVNAYIARNFVASGGALTDLGSHKALDNDATPQVRGSNYLTVKNTLLTTITNLDEGAPGQRVTLIFDTAPNATVATGGSFRLAGGVNFTATANDTLTVILHSGVWYEVSRSVN